MIADGSKISFYFHQLQREDLALWYKGVFDDNITNSIIELADSDTTEQALGKNKKRLGYLMAESFQNIVRHGFKSEDNHIEGTFAISSRKGKFHIFSSNQISDAEVELIQENVERINAMSVEELTTIYRDILMAGTLSEKGGAGLGLIDMVRKSEQPLQYRFIEEKGRTSFAMQVDMDIQHSRTDNNLNIDDALKISNALEDSGTIILFKGNFEEDSTSHVLTMMMRNTDLAVNAQRVDKMIFHTGVELLQNISRHGKSANQVIEGVFELAQKNGIVRVTAQNKVDKKDKEVLETLLNMVNEKTTEELNDLYKVKLKESVMKDTSAAGVGVIDIARSSDLPILYNFEPSGEEFLFTITVRFKKTDEVT